MGVVTSPHTQLYDKNLLFTGVPATLLDNSAGLAAHHMFKLKFFIDMSCYNALVAPCTNSINALATTPISLFLSSNRTSQLTDDFTFSITSLESGFISSLDNSILNSASKVNLSQNKLSQFHNNP